VKVDVNSIPEETGRRFGECIVAGLREYLKQPGAREALEARTRAREERRKIHEAALHQAQGLSPVHRMA